MSDPVIWVHVVAPDFWKLPDGSSLHVAKLAWLLLWRSFKQSSTIHELTKSCLEASMKKRAVLPWKLMQLQ